MSAFVPPPRLAEALMEGALHTQVQRDGIVGDLREEFARRLESRGRLRCELWYWKQAVRVYLRFRMEGRRTGSGTRSRENSSLGQGTPGRGGQTPPLPGPGALQDLGQDLRIALRGLVRSPAFTFIAVLSLAVGISANTALFSLLHATWLTPVPGVSGEGTVVEVLVREGGPEHQEWTFPDFRSVKESSAPMEAWAGWKRRDGTLTTEDGAQRVGVVYASAEYFRVLGVSISRGRGFLPEEDRGVGQRRVAVVSHRLWETRLGGRPDVLGSTVTLNRAPYTVVGVAPEEFHGHRVLEEPPDLWVPLVQHPYLAGEESLASDRTVQWLLVLARLEPGTELEEANAALGTVFDRLAEEYPEANENRSAVVSRSQTACSISSRVSARTSA